MRTRLPFHQQIGWTPNFTPEQNADNSNFALLRQQDMERNTALVADQLFMSALRNTLLRYPYINFDNIIQLAGTQHGQGPYDICDTVDKMLHYWHESEATAEQATKYTNQLLRDAVQQQKVDRALSYKETYDQYVKACQERRARHQQAKVDHDYRMRESQAQLMRETCDPAPVAPRRPA